MKKFESTHAWGLSSFFVVFFSIPKEHSLCSTHPVMLFPALRGFFNANNVL